jgi:cytochrome c5
MTMKNNGMLIMALVLFVMIIILIISGQVSSQQAQSPQPVVSKGQQPGGGTSLLDSRCTVCHSADKAKSAKKDSRGWEKTVTRMMVEGAQLTETEKAELVDYLAKTYPLK